MPTAKELANIQLVKDFNEACNSKDSNKISSFYADDYVLELSGITTPLEQSRAMDEALFKAFPDFHRVYELILAVDDYVITKFRITMTHQDEFYGIPATNRKIDWPGIAIYKIADGKFKEGALFSNRMAMLTQLGVTFSLPEPE